MGMRSGGAGRYAPLAKIILLVAIVVSLPGCRLIGGNDPSAADGSGTGHGAAQIARYDGDKSEAISMVYTTKRELALTFNGMADDNRMKRLLDELDRYAIKATFFLPGMRVAEEPDIARDILSRGHEIENNTLDRPDLSRADYDESAKEIGLTDDVIDKRLGVEPKFVRTASGEYDGDFLLAAAGSGKRAVIGYSLFLHNWKGETDSEKRNYIRKYINRGGIIAIDTEEDASMLETIPLLAQAAADVGYSFVTLDKLVADGGRRKPLEQIEGYDAATINPDYEDATYKLVSHGTAGNKQVALTFDDWGTDYTVTRILDILDRYGIKASFFLRADGVAKNPNLARAIEEAGHDVANHTYSHPVITSVTPEQLQEEIVKAHRIITEAIQRKPTMIFRPPTGEFDEKTLKVVGATGYKTVGVFDVTPDDYIRTNSADDIVKAILEQTTDGSIILLHILDDTHTPEALPKAIEALRSKGYSFVPMSQMTGD